MSANFITSGLINPTQLLWAQVLTQVATLLKIPIQQIERLELWMHQIWIKFVHGRGKFISYRQLPLWLEAGLKAMPSAVREATIARCKDQALLHFEMPRQISFTRKQPTPTAPRRGDLGIELS